MDDKDQDDRRREACDRMHKECRCSCKEGSEGGQARGRKLDTLITLTVMNLVILQKLLVIGKKVMADLSVLEAEVGEIGTVVGSAIVLLDGLKAALDAAGTDPVKLAELSAALDASGNALAEAVVRNTPAA